MNSKNEIKEIIFSNNNTEISNNNNNIIFNKNNINQNNVEKTINIFKNNQQLNNSEEIQFNENNEELNNSEEIQFNEKKNDNNDNNFKNIIFNDIEENNIEKFISNEQNIILDEEVAIKTSDIIYKNDIIYLKDLENQLLSEYPVSKQSEKYIQEIVQVEAQKIIDAKNIGLIKNNMLENNIQYTMIDNIISDIFDSNIIIPIVSDKHKIYIKLKDENTSDEENINKELNENLNAYFSESLENKNGIYEENQKNQMILLKNLVHNKAINKIEYKKYLNEVSDISKPYLVNLDYLGLIKKIKNECLVLRYNDIDNINWNTYLNNSDYITKKDLIDEKGKIKGLENNVLIYGDEINIIGFMILSNNNNNNLKKNFNKIGNINNIYKDGNIIKIECLNHGLNENDVIFIDETNSYPKISNIFSKSVKIIDNNFFTINLNINLLKEGTSGILYKLSKLEYDLYRINKNNDELIIDFKESTYKKTSNNFSHNKLYLFDNSNINKNDYNEIIKNIMPSLDNIIQDKINELKNIYTYDDFNKLFEKYNLKLNDFNIEQLLLVKNIFQENLNKILIDKDYKPILLNFNKNTKNILNSNYFLGDKYIKDPVIEKLYGIYSHINKPEDSLILRLKWVESMNDNGKYYYLNYLLNVQKKIDKIYIQNKIEELSNKLKDLEKNFIKEKSSLKNKSNKMYKYQAYIITKNDGNEEDGFTKLKGKLPDNTVVFYNNNLYIWKNKLIEFQDGIEENTLALVGNELWIWKKNTWIKSNATPKYDKIEYLCTLNNMELSDIKLDSLDCIYRKELGCSSKQFVRLNDSIIKVKDELEKLQELEKNIDLEHFNIQYKMENIKNRYFSFESKIKINNISKINDIPKKSNIISKNNISKSQSLIIDNLSILLNLIMNIKNDNLRMIYIYNLIDKDGITINNDIYSKKYNRSMNICGHYMYFKKINYANNPNEKIKLINEMINLYSDDGYSEKNMHTCKNCGEVINANEYDETEGFSDSGMLKKSRELWKVDIIKEEKTDLFEYLKLSDLDEQNLKEILLKHGMSIDNIDNAISICIFITKNLMPKSGIILPNEVIINIIFDTLQKINTIIPYSIYKMKEIKKLQEKGFSKIDIEKIEEKQKLKMQYEINYKIKKSSIISSRFLISVQTIIPALIRSSKLTICPFYSFNDEEGFTYIACILQEMNIITSKDKTKTMEILKNSITESYNEFKNLVHIKELFRQKKMYDIELEKKKETYKFSIQNEEKDIIESAIIGDEYHNIIKTSKKIDEIYKLKDVLMNRLIYLSKNIKKIVRDVISSSQLTDMYSGILETSCCTEIANSYLNYYYYIENESEYPIKENIDESKYLFNYINYFLQKGSIHKFLLYDKNKFDGIYNYPIVDDEKNTSYKLIQKVFELYVDSGIYSGTLREYVGELDSQIDVKSGFTKKDILSKNYTIEEYINLLKSIEKRNIKYYKDINIESIEKYKLDELKKTSYDKIDSQIKILVKNVAGILNKNKDYIDKYINILRNLGIFENNMNMNKFNNEKEKIKHREYLNKVKLNYIKKFYITVLKKHLSFIKYGHNKETKNINLSFTESDDIMLEMQSIIFNENNKLLPFLNDNVRGSFTSLKFDYTNDEINSINGMDNIYDSKYENIKVYSNFNFNDASNVLLYILVNQLNKFILCTVTNNSSNNDLLNNVNKYNNEEFVKLNNKNEKCKNICYFINLLFEELDSDNDLFNKCNDGTEKINNSIIHDKIEFRMKEYYKEDKDDYLLKKLQKQKPSTSENTIDENDSVEILQEMESADKEYFIMEKGKKELFEKYGYLPSEEQLEEYKQNYFRESTEESEVENEMYNHILDSKIEDLTDQGVGYGFRDDFETGDGFDYSGEQEYD
jgi:hypothetical protein